MTGKAHRPDATDPRAMLDTAVTQSLVGMALFDTEIRYLRINEALCASMGIASESVGLGLRPTELFPRLGFAEFETCARQVILTGEPALWKATGQIPGRSREYAWLVAISPVKDAAEIVCGALAVAIDVTEHRMARRRLALVNDASNRIGSTLDVARTAEELVQVAVPDLADMVMIDIQDSVLRGDEPTSGPVPGTVPLRRMAHGSVLDSIPEAVVQPGEVASYPAGSPAADALASGRSVIQDPTPRDVARWALSDPVRADKAARYGFHSVVAVPLLARGATLGVASFVRHQRPERFEEDDLALAEEIVARAAICIDNARRYTHEHATALALQHSLLQGRQPAQAAVEVATRYLPGSVWGGGGWRLV